MNSLSVLFLAYYFIYFRIVRHSKVDKAAHYTISKQGVTHICDGEAEFTPLDQWEKDLRHYSQLIQIRTFANFRMWKAFYVWKKNVRGRYEYSTYILLAEIYLKKYCFSFIGIYIYSF